MIKNKKTFRETFTLEERKSQFERMKKTNPDNIPIICEQHFKSNIKTELEKSKYLVTPKYRMYQFVHLVRSRLSLSSTDGLYMFVNGNVLLKSDEKIEEVYNKYKDTDGMLYIQYSEYNSFGYL